MTCAKMLSKNRRTSMSSENSLASTTSLAALGANNQVAYRHFHESFFRDAGNSFYIYGCSKRAKGFSQYFTGINLGEVVSTSYDFQISL